MKKILILACVILSACGGGGPEAAPQHAPTTAAQPTTMAAPTIENSGNPAPAPQKSVVPQHCAQFGDVLECRFI
jgi:hypothetical protein